MTMTLSRPLIVFSMSIAILTGSLIVFHGDACHGQDNASAAAVKPAEKTAVKPAEKPATEPADSETAGQPNRHFRFSYGGQLIDLPPAAQVKVWLPIAETNRQQTVVLESSSTPGTMTMARDSDYQNQIGYFEFVSNSKTAPQFQLAYDVDRLPATPYHAGDQQAPDHEDAHDDAVTGGKSSPHVAAVDYSRYLKANRTVPITGKPIDLIKGLSLPTDSTQKARKLYDLVFDHMDYDKSKPGYGNGDSVWACDSRTGNCTDFHSLFISLSRNQSLPSKFEIGFPLPWDKTSGNIGGYHCWAWFFTPEQGWVPVDISEADKYPQRKDQLFGFLPADRITFSTGRDIVLVPASEADPLNFFVYPHVEVDGKVWPKEKIRLDFSFQDLPTPNQR